MSAPEEPLPTTDFTDWGTTDLTPPKPQPKLVSQSNEIVFEIGRKPVKPIESFKVGDQLYCLGVPRVTLLERLGAGGFGTVFRAKHPCYQGVVAAKFLSGLGRASRAAEQRFKVEARVLSALDHPHVVRHLDSFMDDEAYDAGELRLCLVMELCVGGDLRGRLQPCAKQRERQCGSLEPLLRVLSEAGAALSRQDEVGADVANYVHNLAVALAHPPVPPGAEKTDHALIKRVMTNAGVAAAADAFQSDPTDANVQKLLGCIGKCVPVVSTPGVLVDCDACMEPELVRIARGALRGLAAVHARGIVHRDIKPDNLFLRADGEVQIGDFGICLWDKFRDRSGSDAVGTILYAPPEEYDAQPVAGAPSRDIWSMGVTLYELAAVRNPFCGRPRHAEPMAVMCAVMDGRGMYPLSVVKTVGLLPHLSAGFCELVDWMMCRSEPDRPSATDTLAHVALQESTASGTPTHAALQESAASVEVCSKDSPRGRAAVAAQVLRSQSSSPQAVEKIETESEQESVSQPSACAESLPAGWVRHVDRTSGDPFYVHAASGRKQWDEPVQRDGFKPSAQSSSLSHTIAMSGSMGAPKPAADEVPPQHIVIAGAGNRCSGRYTLLQGERVNGWPVWKMDQCDRFLYANHRGCWRVVHDVGAMRDGKGWLCSSEHHGRMPHQVPLWRPVLSADVDVQIQVVECRCVCGGGALSSSLDAIDQPPAALTLSVETRHPAAGLYRVCANGVVNGHPFWECRRRGSRLRLYSDDSGRWKVSDLAGVAAAGGSPTSGVRNRLVAYRGVTDRSAPDASGKAVTWVVSAYHGGALPHRVREWRWAANADLSFDRSIAVSAAAADDDQAYSCPFGATGEKLGKDKVAPPAVLPTGWRQYTDPASGDPYFVCDDGRKQWDRPVAAAAPRTARRAKSPQRKTKPAPQLDSVYVSLG